MSEMHKTPTANRLHIAIFGRRNAGKSSLINALTNQNLAIVSEFAGTTTDPVYKAMEILPIGPVVLIDTAGIDDEGILGDLRVKKSIEVINKTDIALIVTSDNILGEFEEKIIQLLKKKKTPFIIVMNKIDKVPLDKNFISQLENKNFPYLGVSASKKENIDELKKLIINKSPSEFEQPTIVGDLITPDDTVILVIPIDTGMPKGRLILPEVQTMRDILDHNAKFYTTKEKGLTSVLENLKTKPKLVITDSQAFETVSADTPDDILLTSFSILFARQKGDLARLVKGAKALKNLKKGDKILIAEACTHHQQCDDIGRVKLPKWIKEYIGGEIIFDFCNGRDFPNNMKDYKLVLHCGGCMINRREMLSRIDISEENEVPIVNYGVAIACMHNVLDRALKPFPEIFNEWIKQE